MCAAGDASTGRPVEAASTLWWKMELAGKMLARNALFPPIAKEISRVAWDLPRRAPREESRKFPVRQSGCS